MNVFKPKLKVNSLDEINLKKHWEEGKRGIILDLDNTIVLWNKTELSTRGQSFLRKAQALNYKIFLLSNAGHQRTKIIAQKYNLAYLAPAFKPRKKAFLKAAKNMNLSKTAILVIGDQIFTDIWGGNRSGCYTILVDPLSPSEFLGTKLLRFFEFLLERGATKNRV